MIDVATNMVGWIKQHLGDLLWFVEMIYLNCWVMLQNGLGTTRTLTWYFVRYCGWKKSCTNSDGWNPLNHGTNHLSTGGYLPSTVIMAWGWLRCPTPGHILDWPADASSPKKTLLDEGGAVWSGIIILILCKLYLITSDNIKVIFDDIWLYLILIVGSTAIVGLSENRAPQSGEWAGVYPLVYPHFQTLFS